MTELEKDFMKVIQMHYPQVLLEGSSTICTHSNHHDLLMVANLSNGLKLQSQKARTYGTLTLLGQMLSYGDSLFCKYCWWI